MRIWILEPTRLGFLGIRIQIHIPVVCWIWIRIPLDPELFAESRSIIKIFIFRIGDGSVADPGCLSRIPDPEFSPSRILDLGSRIQQNKRRSKKIFLICLIFFLRSAYELCAHDLLVYGLREDDLRLYDLRGHDLREYDLRELNVCEYDLQNFF
jgi:hypothetical protein